MQTALDQHIEIALDVRGGKPCIAGTRIAVSDVVFWHLRLGQSLEQIAGHYGVALASLHAAMAYYYDHQSDIEQAMRDEEAFLQEAREASSSVLQAKLKTTPHG
jgi:uncharacterized protein (DUF433 family)